MTAAEHVLGPRKCYLQTKQNGEHEHEGPFTPVAPMPLLAWSSVRQRPQYNFARIVVPLFCTSATACLLFYQAKSNW